MPITSRKEVLVGDFDAGSIVKTPGDKIFPLARGVSGGSHADSAAFEAATATPHTGWYTWDDTMTGEPVNSYYNGTAWCHYPCTPTATPSGVTDLGVQADEAAAEAAAGDPGFYEWEDAAGCRRTSLQHADAAWTHFRSLKYVPITPVTLFDSGVGYSSATGEIDISAFDTIPDCTAGYQIALFAEGTGNMRLSGDGEGVTTPLESRLVVKAPEGSSDDFNHVVGFVPALSEFVDYELPIGTDAARRVRVILHGYWVHVA